MGASLFCSKCGGALVPDSRYCLHCGSALSASPLNTVKTIIMGGSSVELLPGESILFEIPNSLLLTNKRVAAMSDKDGKKTFSSAFIKDIDAVAWQTEEQVGWAVLGGVLVAGAILAALAEAKVFAVLLGVIGGLCLLEWLTERKSWLVFWVGGNQFIRADARGVKSHQKVQDFVNRFSELKDIASRS